VIIDVHNHPDWYGFPLPRFLANMDAFGIDKTWILSWECPRDEYDPAYNPKMPENGTDGPIPFSVCLAYVLAAPERFVLGYAPDPRKPDAIDRLEAMREIHGVRVCGELKLRMMYDDWDALRLYRWCGKAGLPVTVHLDYEFDTGRRYPRPNWWYGGGMESFERAVAACPDTVFLGHAPGFWAHVSADGKHDKEAYPTGPVVPGGKLVRMMRTYPNLCCDMSAGSAHTALSRDLVFTKEFILEFQDRMLFARDYFDNRMMELIRSLGLPADVQEKVFSGNALRLAPEPPAKPAILS
jgi:predicted TIM-barrel fold metal-dependent hydrolase